MKAWPFTSRAVSSPSSSTSSDYDNSVSTMTDMKRASIERKPDDNFIERSLTDPIKKEAMLGDPEADYSGAVKKTDPAEISLVRKLDYRIMPTLWAMYFLNYVRALSTHFLDTTQANHHSLIETPLPRRA